METKNKRYVVVTTFEGWDKLYTLSKSKERKFEKLFGQFDQPWEDHLKAVEWLMENGKFVSNCSCVGLAHDV